MNIEVKPGRYVVAVSGGVDSVVLLDILRAQPQLEIIVAHYNHGIRKTAEKDEEFVRALAHNYDVLFEAGRGHLGEDASEEQARDARYKFLNAVREKHEAEAIVTAHHQDDLIETALINILRGTGPRGLIAMNQNKAIIRPFLNFEKKQILAYAKSKGLSWVEDETNDDIKYLRNRLRKVLLANLTEADRQNILSRIEQLDTIERASSELLEQLNEYIFQNPTTVNRSAFICLPSDIANEIVARWMRQNKISLDSAAIQRLSVHIKTAKPNSLQNVKGAYRLRLTKTNAHLEIR